MRLSLLTLLIAFTPNCYSSNINNIDFNSLTHTDDNYTYYGRVYFEDGYKLDANNDLGFANWGTLSENYTGSPSLLNDAGPGLTTLSRADNRPFNLVSISLAGLFIKWPANGSTQIKVTFIGTKIDNSSIKQTFTGPFTSENYTFNNFTNLSKVEWLQDNDTLGLRQFDDIVVSSVPVPPSMSLLLGGGLFGITLIRRYKSVYDVS